MVMVTHGKQVEREARSCGNGKAGGGKGKSRKREVMVDRHGNGKGNGNCAARRGNPPCACAFRREFNI